MWKLGWHATSHRKLSLPDIPTMGENVREAKTCLKKIGKGYMLTPGNAEIQCGQVSYPCLSGRPSSSSRSVRTILSTDVTSSDH